jgi:glycosyltransferase involved in cell wall biosynthesis
MKILWLTWKDRKNPLAGGAEIVNEELAKRLVQNGHEVIFLVGGFPCHSREGGNPEKSTLPCHSGESRNPENSMPLCHSGESRNPVPVEKDGFKIIRLGNRWTVYWQAYKYYKKNLIGWADLVIDEINTIPFFAKFYVNRPLQGRGAEPGEAGRVNSPLERGGRRPGCVNGGTRNILFIHQLCREIWFYEMFFPLSLIGYIIEPIYLWLLRDREVITVSESTKNDLIKIGFKPENIHIISEGIEVPLLSEEGLGVVKKFDAPTILSLGTIRAMKRTHHTIKAFEIARKKIPNLKLIIIGSAEGKYGQKVLKLIKKINKNSPLERGGLRSGAEQDGVCKNSPLSRGVAEGRGVSPLLFKEGMGVVINSDQPAIQYLGKVSKEKKIELLQKSHLITNTPVREGWGLTVTEANSQGTPAVVYNAPGLRDSVRNGQTGIITKKNTPTELAKSIVELLNSDRYDTIRQNAWEWSREINFEKSYKDFINIFK